MHLPLSIGDGELAETADLVVSVPEIFAYWLQGERIDVGFLGAAQIDRFGNLNSTVIGDYERPKVRLPGAGGAPEIARACREILVVLRQTPRAFVGRARLSLQLGRARVRGDHRSRHPRARPGDARARADAAASRASRVDEARAATGWPLRVADEVTRLRAADRAKSSPHSASLKTTVEESG